MMLYDEKKATATIMGRRRDKDGSKTEAPMVPSSARTDDGEPDARLEAMKDFLMASKEGHPRKMMEAMAAFHDLHSRMKDDTEDAD